MRPFVEDGLYWVTDHGFASALAVQGVVITRDRKTGKRVPNPTQVLPACEYSHAKLRVVAIRKHKKRPAGWFARDLPGDHTKEEDTIQKPIVLFAFKPYRGSFELHRKKLRLWYNGGYWPSPEYATEFRRLRRVIEAVKRKFRVEAKARRRAGHTLIDAEVKPGEKEDVNAIEDRTHD